jgi:hypothetical protein
MVNRTQPGDFDGTEDYEEVARRERAADDDPNDRCTNPGGHSWVCTGTQYGGDDESYHGEGRCYCEWCGADGDA